MRRARAIKLAKEWESRATLEGARLPQELIKKIGGAVAALLRSFAEPETEDPAPAEALKDGALMERVKPLFKSSLLSARRSAAWAPDERGVLKAASSAERAARLQGLSSEGVDALWELALREDVAGSGGASSSGGFDQWVDDLGRINASGGLSARLGWALLEFKMDRLFHDNAAMWAGGGWSELIEGASRAAVELEAQLSAREAEQGDTGWAGERELLIVQGLRGVAEVGASWPAEGREESLAERAARESRERGEDPDIQQLRAEWAMGRRPRPQSEPATRVAEARIRPQAIEAARQALPECDRLMERVRAARAPKAANVKTRRV